MIKDIYNWIKSKQYLAYFSICLFILDFYVRYINRTMKSFSVLELIPNLFTVFWILILCITLYICKNKYKKYLVIFYGVLFTFLSYVQVIYSRIYSKFFSFTDLIYTGEAMDYLDTIFGYIKIIDFVILLSIIVLIILSIKTLKYEVNESNSMKILTIFIVFSLAIVINSFSQYKIGEESSLTGWDAFSNKRNIYNQFNDTKRSFMLCGLYEYYIRDFSLTFFKKEKNHEETIKEINEYINNQNKTISNKNGVYKDKNLMFIMLENIDTWMLNEKSMPTLYNLKQNSIDFVNHYSVTYASGATFNTEFIANTGLIPNITELRTSYSYNKNNYDYSLANLFKSQGYLVNSIHKNKGGFYNRDNMHLAWGYSNHYDYSKLDLSGNIDIDTELVKNNLDKFIYDEKFMTYFITYSAHMPYNYEKVECQVNIDYIKTIFKSDNEEYLCAMSQAKVTDDAIKIIVDELKNKDMLDDTILVFFVDHFAYSMNQDMVSEIKGETNWNLKTKTPFFIYNNGKDKEIIEKVNTSIDILPTVADLFGLEYNPNIYSGNSLFSNETGVAYFNDYSWYDGNIYYKGDTQLSEEQKIINQNAKDSLTIGGKIIESDYFRYYDLNNKKRSN